MFLLKCPYIGILYYKYMENAKKQPILAHLTLLMAFLPLLKKEKVFKTRRKFAKESIEGILNI